MLMSDMLSYSSHRRKLYIISCAYLTPIFIFLYSLNPQIDKIPHMVLFADTILIYCTTAVMMR